MDKLTASILLVIVISYIVYSNLSITGDVVSKENGKNIIEATVSQVIDGDTIELDTGETVRLLGINSQEKGQKCYSQATNRMKELVEGKVVALEKDEEEYDKYGRLLMYVYVGDIFVNKVMLSEGLASLYILGNSTFHKEELVAAESAKIGCIWEKSGSCLDCIGIEYFKANAEGDDCKNLNGEYVTFVNTCSYSCDMSKWSVKDDGRNTYNFPVFSLGSKKKVILYTGKGSNSKTELYWNREGKTCRSVWNNDGDTLYLRDSLGDLVLEYGYEMNDSNTKENNIEIIDEILEDPEAYESETQIPQANDTQNQNVSAILVINEIMYHPIQKDDYNEWLEIYNPSEVSVDLEGWSICNKSLLAGYIKHNDSLLYLDHGLMLSPKSFAVITDGGSGTDAYDNFDISGLAIHVDASSICSRLSNSGKEITLENYGKVIDSVVYTNDFADGNGKSLEKGGNLWVESLVDGGTPGKENS